MTNSHPNPADVTRLLHEWRSGHKDALDRLMPLVYEELHFMASRHRSRERSGGPLQTTALVNEAYLKLVGQRNVAWQNRAHFFAIAATLMRRIVVDQARRDQRPKHGGDAIAVSLDDVPGMAEKSPVDAVDAIALDAALSKLETLDSEQARIVELRFFGGLTVEETGEVMDRTEWRPSLLISGSA